MGLRHCQNPLKMINDDDVKFRGKSRWNQEDLCRERRSHLQFEHFQMYSLWNVCRKSLSSRKVRKLSAFFELFIGTPHERSPKMSEKSYLKTTEHLRFLLLLIEEVWLRKEKKLRGRKEKVGKPISMMIETYQSKLM